MAKYPENSWGQLKSELNVRFAEVNDTQHAFAMSSKARQVKNKSVQVYTDRLYVWANDVFAKVDKAVVESQLIGVFIDGLHHDFLQMKVMRQNPKTFQTAVQYTLAKQNLRKRFHLRSNDHDHPKTRSEKPM